MQSSAPALESGLPFVGMLASIAVLPIVAPRFWHRRMGVRRLCLERRADAPQKV